MPVKLKHGSNEGEILDAAGAADSQPTLLELPAVRRSGFKDLLPRAGFNWPVFEHTLSGKMHAGKLALDNDSIKAIMAALQRSHNAFLTQNTLPGPPPSLRKAHVDEQLALLFDTAADSLQQISLDVIATEGGRYDFWYHVMATAPFVPEGQSEHKAWFSASYKNLIPITCEMLHSLAVLTVNARQYALDRPEYWARVAYAQGKLAKAVDRFVGRLKGDITENPGAWIAYFTPVKGARFYRDDGLQTKAATAIAESEDKDC